MTLYSKENKVYPHKIHLNVKQFPSQNGFLTTATSKIEQLQLFVVIHTEETTLIKSQ